MTDIAKSIFARLRQDAVAPGSNLAVKTQLVPGVVIATKPAGQIVRRAASSRPISPATNRALKSIGLGVKTARQARRLTQQELAARAGIARKTLVAIEAGAGSASMAAFLEVITVLDEDVLDGIVGTLRSDPTGKRLLEAGMPKLVIRRKRQPKAGAVKVLGYRKPR